VGDSKKYFEIGSHNLGSALLVEQHAKTLGVEREIFALDLRFSPWANLNYERASSNVARIECSSNDLRTYKDDLEGTDFIFIDGFHSFAQVVRDFELSYDLMTNGGIIAFHDTSPNLNKPEYVEKCTEYARDNLEYLTQDDSENFYVDEAICFILDQYQDKADLELIDCTVECYHPRETRLNSWIRGKTSPHSAIWAMKVTK
tara:strand:+ start:1789 stop:2394 length:606 start_codon:yes stop_codon:yes gene_type:complete